MTVPRPSFTNGPVIVAVGTGAPQRTSVPQPPCTRIQTHFTGKGVPVKGRVHPLAPFLLSLVALQDLEGHSAGPGGRLHDRAGPRHVKEAPTPHAWPVGLVGTLPVRALAAVSEWTEEWGSEGHPGQCRTGYREEGCPHHVGVLRDVSCTIVFPTCTRKETGTSWRRPCHRGNSGKSIVLCFAS